MKNASISEDTMQTLTASQARSNLYRIIDEAAANHEPVVITGKRNNAVLISTEDWASIQETMYLLSVPGMRESIMEGLQTSVGECTKELEW
ncbi:MAG: type II toxin-antitoxin system Phd/YefM family antitoxin [Chlorobium sp.]